MAMQQPNRSEICFKTKFKNRHRHPINRSSHSFSHIHADWRSQIDHEIIPSLGSYTYQGPWSGWIRICHAGGCWTGRSRKGARGLRSRGGSHSIAKDGWKSVAFGRCAWKRKDCLGSWNCAGGLNFFEFIGLVWKWIGNQSNPTRRLVGGLPMMHFVFAIYFVHTLTVFSTPKTLGTWA